jgi:hypothetical protein
MNPFEGNGKSSTKKPNKEQGAWICYQIRRGGLTQEDIARRAAVSQQMVQRVIYGIGTSHKVQKAIVEALGFDSWSDLTAARQGAAA